MRVLIIDSEKKEIREDDLTGLTALQKAVGGYIESAFEFPNGDTIFVNEEGLFERPLPNHWFVVAGAHQPFVGNGVIAGHNRETGETVPADITLEGAKKRIKFIDRQTAATMSNLIDAAVQS